MENRRRGTEDRDVISNSTPNSHVLHSMNSHSTPGRLALRLPLLLCAGLLAWPLSTHADDRGRGHGNNHHYNPHFNGRPPGHVVGHGNGRGNYSNFKQYNHQHGYYPGYYKDYTVYAPNYRGQRYYNNSNYGQNPHNTLLNQLLNRL